MKREFKAVKKTVTRIYLASPTLNKVKERGYTLSHLIRILLEELLESPQVTIKPKLEGDKVVCITLPETILEMAKRVARSKKLTLSQLIEALVEKWLEVTDALYG